MALKGAALQNYNTELVHRKIFIKNGMHLNNNNNHCTMYIIDAIKIGINVIG